MYRGFLGTGWEAPTYFFLIFYIDMYKRTKNVYTSYKACKAQNKRYNIISYSLDK
jgi:hypothetical protein